jgi:uncharacterized protein (DUF924 family)
MNVAPEGWIDEVLEFWFGQLTPEAWFEKNDATDTRIRTLFGELYGRLSQTLPADATASARGALAAIIVLDQFPRNMFRNSPKAFATDDQALALAEAAIERGFDRALPEAMRQFLYMPFQHSEDQTIQRRSVDLFATLGDTNNLDYAQQHQDIIDRFGRFPHRNEALGRISTDAELSFLQEDGSSF